MKAKIRKTGEEIDVRWDYARNIWINLSPDSERKEYANDDLLTLPETNTAKNHNHLYSNLINWEQRRWEASLSLLSAMVTETHYTNITEKQIRGSIEISDKLIEEFKKQSK